MKTSKANKTALACGGELKNTFCFAKSVAGRGPSLYLSPIIGGLENADAYASFEKTLNEYEIMLESKPEIIVHDLHPEYFSTKYALERIKKTGARGVGVQHHYAHAVACAADSLMLDEIPLKNFSGRYFETAAINPEENFIGVSFDGLGYGDDGNLWGAEFLIFNFRGYKRASRLEYVPLPGGAAAIREPWRMACVYLQDAFGDSFASLKIPFTENLPGDEWKTIKQMADKKINSPLISSMGRLFDAVAAITGIRNKVDFEAQAAIELEAAATQSKTGQLTAGSNSTLYKFDIKEGEPIRTAGVMRGIVEDIKRGMPVSDISLKFHLSVAELILDTCKMLKKSTGINRLTLSGGVFQNRLLSDSAASLLRASGFDVHTHKFLKPDDSSISVGQILGSGLEL